MITDEQRKTIEAELNRTLSQFCFADPKPGDTIEIFGNRLTVIQTDPVLLLEFTSSDGTVKQCELTKAANGGQ